MNTAKTLLHLTGSGFSKRAPQHWSSLQLLKCTQSKIISVLKLCALPQTMYVSGTASRGYSEVGVY